MNAGIIYKYTSPSNKVYIGQTVDEQGRISKHKWQAKNNPKDYFHKALAKYGFNNFKYEVLFYTKSNSKENLKVILNTMEKYYIKKYQSNIKGYNLTDGGEGILNASTETRDKIRKANLGRKKSSTQIRKISNTLKEGYASGRIKVMGAKKVIVYLNGKFYKQYDSCADASRELGTSKTSIANVLAGRAKQTKQGYTFKLQED